MKKPYKDKIGKERVYSQYYKERGRDDVITWDVVPLGIHTKLIVEFLSKNSYPHRQGLTLRTDTSLVVNGQRSPAMNLWYPETKLLFFKTSPMKIECAVESVDGLLSVYNIYEVDSKRKASLGPMAGMLVTEVSPTERVYACQDQSPNPRFDRLKFKITLLE